MKSRLLRHPLLYYILLIISILLMTGCTNDNGKNLPAINQEFTDFTTQLFTQEVSSNTINLHYTLQDPSKYGIKKSPVTFGSYNINGTLALAGLENCLAVLDCFTYNSLNTENQLTYEILKSYLETEIEGAPFTLYEEPLSPVTGMQAQLPVLLSEYQFYSTSDIDIYLALLSELPTYFQSLIVFEKAKIESNLFIPASTVAEIIKQCNAFISLNDHNYLLSSFTDRIKSMDKLSEKDVSVYTDLNKTLVNSKVLPAYEALISFLQSASGKGTNTKGLYYFPNGSDYYRHLVKRDTGSSRTVEELQKLTINQIQEDLYTIESILTSKQGENTTNLDMTPLLTESNPLTILLELQTQMGGGFPTPPPVDIQVKNVPTDMEPYLSPAFYMIPAIDNASENVIYINQAQMADTLELYTTLAHEGYPGHLYQTTYFANKNLAPIRSLLNYGGYTEGWATFAEMSSYYMSPLPKLHATLLQKNASVILGLYSLADMGIHLEGWTLLETVTFFSNYGITNTDTIKQIYQYIISDPGNYLKYYIGYVEFLELKKEASDLWGNDFTHLRFHKAVLDVGPAPFEVVREQVLK